MRYRLTSVADVPEDGYLFTVLDAHGGAAETTLPLVDIEIENEQVYLIDDVRCLHEGPSDDDNDDIPGSTSHLSL